ncbi:uncharacterized protein LOC128195296 [Vigna angularis]|uniref:uncharacterized protein LOC128195296 n=1 Tax=Phaseolus angularis TaxID=3914 RepID=UPI0022B2EDB8|nr:uncharacterized protein LOC128195296 [Vigna angularis]
MDLIPLPNAIDFVHQDGVSKSKFIKELHHKVKNQIQQQNEKYAKQHNKGKKELIFNEGDLVGVHLRKERFPQLRKSKLNPRGDGPFRVIRRINNNAYQIDLPPEYGVHATFNVSDLKPFAGYASENEDPMDLRANPCQDGGDDTRRPSTIGPITRGMIKKIQDDLLERPKCGLLDSHGLLLLVWLKLDTTPPFFARTSCCVLHPFPTLISYYQAIDREQLHSLQINSREQLVLQPRGPSCISLLDLHK